MATSLSVDLRRRVVTAVEGGIERQRRTFEWACRARSTGWRRRARWAK
jgi:hypothetical protein